MVWVYYIKGISTILAILLAAYFYINTGKNKYYNINYLKYSLLGILIIFYFLFEKFILKSCSYKSMELLEEVPLKFGDLGIVFIFILIDIIWYLLLKKINREKEFSSLILEGLYVAIHLLFGLFVATVFLGPNNSSLTYSFFGLFILYSLFTVKTINFINKKTENQKTEKYIKI